MVLRATLFAIAVLASGFTVHAASGPLYNKAVYNPVTKSYFELVTQSDMSGFNWDSAYQMAIGRLYKGERGRLAIVRDPNTNEFLRRTFRPDKPAWIGLRYWCKLHRSTWPTGAVLARGEYENWHATARKLAIDCPYHARPYLPAYYAPLKDGFRWRLTGGRKKWRTMFVEYPTGKE